MPDARDGRCVVVYERVSTSHQDVARQEAQRGIARAEYPQSEVVVVEDDGVSAFKVSIFDRPGGRALCDLIEAGRVEAVCADAQDRLSRGRLSEWAQFWDLCDRHNTRVLIDGREIDFDDEADEMMGALGAIMARRESRERSHRIRSAYPLYVRKLGRKPGGRRRYGRMSDYTLVASEVAVIRERLVRPILAGDSELQIARALNQEGLPGPSGGRWHGATIAGILRRPDLAGLVQVEGRLERGSFEPILDAETWERLRAFLAARDSGPERRGRGPAEPFLLGAPVAFTCGCCGGPLVPRSGNRRKDGTRQLSYVCRMRLRDGTRACSQRPIDRDAVDGAVSAWMWDGHLDLDATRLEVEEAARSVVFGTRGSLADAERQEMRTRTHLEKIEGDYLDGHLPPADYARLAAKLGEELAAASEETERLRARLADLEGGGSLADAQRRALDYLAAVRATLERARGSSPENREAHVAAARAALATVVEEVVLVSESAANDFGVADVEAVQVKSGRRIQLVPRKELAVRSTRLVEVQGLGRGAMPVALAGSAPLPLADNHAFTSTKTSSRPLRTTRSSS